MRLRVPDSGTEECCSEFSERRVTLGAHAFGFCHRDILVFGVVSGEAAVVRVRMADVATVDAKLYDAPESSRVRARYFVVALPEGTAVRLVQ